MYSSSRFIFLCPLLKLYAFMALLFKNRTSVLCLYVPPQMQSIAVYAHNIFPHASPPSRQHRGTTIQPYITREETNRRLRHPPIRPSLMPRLPISRRRLRYGETSVADCAPPQDESTPDALHPRKGCPRCGATNTPMPTLVLLSHHRSSRATCWIVWMFNGRDRRMWRGMLSEVL
jgi:hypothetical protein